MAISLVPWWLNVSRAAALGSALLLGAAAQAHNVWLAPDAQGGYVLPIGGQAGQLEAFDPDKVTHLQAFDARGRNVDVSVSAAEEGGVRVKRLTLMPSGNGSRALGASKMALFAMAMNNGHFSGPETGDMKPVPMDENPGATRGVYALKFHKTVITWNALTQRELGQQFELLPLQGKSPHVGEWLPVKVLLDGKPLAGARVSLGEHGTPATSDAQGLVKIKVGQGTNHIQAIFRQPVSGNPKTTQNSYEALFSFAAHAH